MSPEMIGVLGVSLLLIFMGIGIPVAISFMVSGFIGTAILMSFDVSLASLTRMFFYWGSNYMISSVPLFMMMGILFSKTGLASQLFDAANKWVHRLPGGLAVGSIFGSAAFAAISGSSVAGAAAMCSICYPEMKKFNYDSSLATGVIAAGGTKSIMIPPSLAFIIYGIISEQSIGKLFVAGLIPGILSTILYSLFVIILVKVRPNLAPRSTAIYTWQEKLSSLKYLLPTLSVFLLVVGGIFLGIFTPIEAGGVGASGVIVVSLILRKLSLKNFFSSLSETVEITTKVFMLFIGSMIFNVFITHSGLPMLVAKLFGEFENPLLVVAIMMFFYIPLGMFMDTTGMIVLTLPLYLPTLIALDVNLIWFGVLAVMTMEIGMITPPVGLNVYVVQGITKVPSSIIFKGIAPFFVSDILLLIIGLLFPAIILFLPSFM